jgi:hypothetical protein
MTAVQSGEDFKRILNVRSMDYAFSQIEYGR